MIVTIILKRWVIQRVIFLSIIACLLPVSCRKEQKNKEPAPVKVKTVRINQENINRGFSYSAVIEAKKNINLSFLVAGNVIEVTVDEGSEVKTGQILARIDDTNYRSASLIAKVKAQQAEDAYNRYKPMFDNGNIPAITMVEIRTKLSEAEQMLKIAEKELDSCVIKAPSNGYISYKGIEAGDNVSPEQTVLKIADFEDIYAVISVPEKDIHKIQSGMDAVIKTNPDDERNINIPALVSLAGVSADPLSRTYTVKVSAKNSNLELLPGMIVRVFIIQKDNNIEEINIPAAAVTIDNDGENFVYLVDETTDAEQKKVYKRKIMINGFAGDKIAVSSGLQLNDLLVTEGIQKLHDGDLITDSNE